MGLAFFPFQEIRQQNDGPPDLNQTKEVDNAINMLTLSEEFLLIIS